MFMHNKKLQYTVRVNEPNPVLGTFMLEQFGGPDGELAAAIGAGLPVLPTQAGHDAGVLQAAGIPSAMLFVRNPTGVSHSPLESASMADCLAGVVALADTLQRLTGGDA